MKNNILLHLPSSNAVSVSDVAEPNKQWEFSCVSSRLYVLQGGLAQQEWRVPELLHRLLQYLEPKLTQVYKNVRERIGRWVIFFFVFLLLSTHSKNNISYIHVNLITFLLCCLSSVLTYIFMIDVNLPFTQPTSSPRISDFTKRILLKLKPLTEGDEEIQNHVIEENEVEEQDERTQAIKLLKTGEFIRHINRSLSPKDAKGLGPHSNRKCF